MEDSWSVGKSDDEGGRSALGILGTECETHHVEQVAQS